MSENQRERRLGRGPVRAISVVVAMALAAALEVAGAPGSSAATCIFDPPSATATVTMSSEDIAIVRSGDAIVVAGQPCGAATVYNTDTVAVTGGPGDDVLRIWLDGGPFLPGLTKPIDFTVDLGANAYIDTMAIVGGSGPDTITFGSNGINLAFDQDPDVTFTAVENLASEGADGNDVITGQGGDGTGGPIAMALGLVGGPGDDRLTGGTGRDLIQGNAGDDLLDGATSGPGGDGLTYINAPGAVTVNLATNSATGADGTDTISNLESVSGGAFDDTITGDAGPNKLVGAMGADHIFGGVGADILRGEAGNDALDGQADVDTVSFATSATGVTVDLQAGTATGEGTDGLTSVESIQGSYHDDVLRGDGGANSIDALDGNDELTGRGADDGIIGGAGTDTASYSTAAGPVNVDLTAGSATGGAGNDGLSGIENVIGSGFADTITGSAGPNALDGRAGADVVFGAPGDDSLVGGTGDDQLYGDDGNDILAGNAGNDLLDGRLGTDLITYATAPGPVDVDLTAASATGEGSDRLTSIESIGGSAGSDHLVGSSDANAIYGRGGDDDLFGLAGADALYGGPGNDDIDGGVDADVDVCVQGPGVGVITNCP